MVRRCRVLRRHLRLWELRIETVLDLRVGTVQELQMETVQEFRIVTEALLLPRLPDVGQTPGAR
jgi:hypothetical protein